MKSKLRLYGITLLLFLTGTPLATALQSSAPESGGETSAPKIPRVPPPPPDPSTSPPPQNMELTPDLIIISGRVIKDDGSPPPFGTVIERDCGGAVIKEELVDSNGNFNFILQR